MRTFGFALNVVSLTLFFEFTYILLSAFGVSIPEIMFTPLGVLTTFTFVISMLAILEFQK
ncbi:MAG: hypothetical protein ABID38_06305 [Candidatus Diapherotrites archaeon]